MTDRFYIDGKDAFTEYGVFVQEDGYNELVAFPSRAMIGRRRTASRQTYPLRYWTPKNFP